MSILIAAGIFAAVFVSVFVSALLLGEAVNYKAFAKSGFAILGTFCSFSLSIAVAISSAGNLLSWVFACLAGLIFGVMMRGALD